MLKQPSPKKLMNALKKEASISATVDVYDDIEEKDLRFVHVIDDFTGEDKGWRGPEGLGLGFESDSAMAAYLFPRYPRGNIRFDGDEFEL